MRRFQTRATRITAAAIEIRALRSSKIRGARWPRSDHHVERVFRRHAEQEAADQQEGHHTRIPIQIGQLAMTVQQDGGRETAEDEEETDAAARQDRGAGGRSPQPCRPACGRRSNGP